MRKLILKMSISVDGILARPLEELDFARSRSADGVAWLLEKLSNVGGHVLGRKSFCEMASYWPTANHPLAPAMNNRPKIVFTRKGLDVSSIAIPHPTSSGRSWREASILTQDLMKAVQELKRQDGQDLVAHGGVELAQSLVEADLIDEYWLLTHPIVAGQGLRLFEKLTRPTHLKLIETHTFSTGTLAHIYRPST